MLNAHRAARVTRTSRHRTQLADLPAGLYPYWAASAKNEFPGIASDAFFFVRAADALMTFFACVSDSDSACALPSMAADSVWHAWMRFNSIGLDAFCVRHFGRAVPHLAAADMASAGALAACLVKARRLEGLAPAGPRLPNLFALDRDARMPGGFGYQGRNGQVAYARLDQRGRCQDTPAVLDSLTPHTLLETGLISPGEHAHWLRRAPQSDSGDGAGWIGGDSGSSCSSGGACDSGGADGGCDSGASSCGSGGGSSCGSSCGSS